MTLLINEDFKSQIITYDKKFTVFDAITVPSISFKDYLKRMIKFTYCSQESVICALIFLDRIFQLNIGFFLHEKNLHRFDFFIFLKFLSFFVFSYFLPFHSFFEIFQNL